MSNFIAKYISPFLKAHVAGLSAAATLAITDANGNLNNLSALTGNQWIGVAIALLGIGGLVAVAPANQPYVPFAPVSAGAADAPVAVAAPVAQDA